MPLPTVSLDAARILPEDHANATLIARVWRPDLDGPSVVFLHPEGPFDISETFPTIRDLCEARFPADAVRIAKGPLIGSLPDMLANTPPDQRDPEEPWLLAPIDLQAIKAAGVTFAVSMLERVIEERAHGDPAAAASIRNEIQHLIGDDLARLRPGSDTAMTLKQALIRQNMWSQYLEVGIGPDAEIFTKSQPMSAVGVGADAGIHPASAWNNPEPEVVLVVNSAGQIVGATLGNDVNLRDFEGRSALLLGKAKDNNASCAIGPFLRLFDDGFTLDDVRQMEVSLSVVGPEGFELTGGSSIARISRDPTDLVAQMMGPHHQYPDGAALFLGTMFAPIQDRDRPGEGFTHKIGDIVTVSTPKLGALVNRIVHCDQAAPWTFGAGHLMRNLARRKLI